MKTFIDRDGIATVIGFLIALLIFGHIGFQKGRFCINNERVGFFLLKGGYRAWWIRYSNGLKYPYRSFKDNLWCFPKFEHCDVRLIIKEKE